MIARVWRGWAAHKNADALETVLASQSIPAILSKSIPGVREAQLLRLERLGETEFVIVVLLDDMDAVRALALARGAPGDDFERAIVSARARELLRRYDTKAEHYEVKAIARA
jgi:hypothetical protein